jgi:hypothetical protein
LAGRTIDRMDARHHVRTAIIVLTVKARISHQKTSPWARYARPLMRYRAVAKRPLEEIDTTMRQPTKPFIVERKPSRKPKPDAHKPSIWGRLDADIAQSLKAQRDMEQSATTLGDDRS